jgi:hypothetical protein
MPEATDGMTPVDLATRHRLTRCAPDRARERRPGERGHCQAHAQHQTHRSRTGSPVAAGTSTGPAILGGLSPLGIPNWLLQAGGLILPPPMSAPARLSLPEIHPAQRAAQVAAGPASRARSRLWMLIVFGGPGLIGGAGGHFFGWPGLGRRKRGASGPR